MALQALRLQPCRSYGGHQPSQLHRSKVRADLLARGHQKRGQAHHAFGTSKLVEKTLQGLLLALEAPNVAALIVAET